MRCSPTTSSAASISLSTTPKRSRNRTTSSRSKKCSSLRSCTRASPTWKSSLPAAPRNCCWCTRKKTRNCKARVRRQHRARGLRVYGTTVGTGVLVDGPFEIRRLHFLQELLKLFHLVIEGFLQGDRLLGDRIRSEERRVGKE